MTRQRRTREQRRAHRENKMTIRNVENLQATDLQGNKKVVKNKDLTMVITTPGPVFGYMERRMVDKLSEADVELNFLVNRKCSKEGCHSEEDLSTRFRTCANCLTPYCSRQCQKEDWTSHHSRCYSIEAYESKLRRFESVTIPSNPGKEYIDLWKVWVIEPDILFTLKRANLKLSQVHPSVFKPSFRDQEQLFNE